MRLNKMGAKRASDFCWRNLKLNAFIKANIVTMFESDEKVNDFHRWFLSKDKKPIAVEIEFKAHETISGAVECLRLDADDFDENDFKNELRFFEGGEL